MPVRGVLGTDYLTVRPDFKVIRNPYGDDDLVIVPAITPDTAVIHAFRADSNGTVIADRRQDNWLLAQAARRVIVTVEEVVKPGDLIRESFDTVISDIHVDAIVHAPGGAHPTSCRGYYQADPEHLRQYLDCAGSDDGFQGYLGRFIQGSESAYRATVERAERNE